MAVQLGGRYDLFARLCPIISNLGLRRGALSSRQRTATLWRAVAFGIGLKVSLKEGPPVWYKSFFSPWRRKKNAPPVNSLGSSVLTPTFLHLPFSPKLCVWTVCLSARYYITHCWLAAPLWCSDQHRKRLHHRLEGCRFCFVHGGSMLAAATETQEGGAAWSGLSVFIVWSFVLVNTFYSFGLFKWNAQIESLCYWTSTSESSSLVVCFHSLTWIIRLSWIEWDGWCIVLCDCVGDLPYFSTIGRARGLV